MSLRKFSFDIEDFSAQANKLSVSNRLYINELTMSHLLDVNMQDTAFWNNAKSILYSLMQSEGLITIPLSKQAAKTPSMNDADDTNEEDSDADDVEDKKEDSLANFESVANAHLLSEYKTLLNIEWDTKIIFNTKLNTEELIVFRKGYNFKKAILDQNHPLPNNEDEIITHVDNELVNFADSTSTDGGTVYLLKYYPIMHNLGFSLYSYEPPKGFVAPKNNGSNPTGDVVPQGRMSQPTVKEAARGRTAGGGWRYKPYFKTTNAALINKYKDAKLLNETYQYYVEQSANNIINSYSRIPIDKNTPIEQRQIIDSALPEDRQKHRRLDLIAPKNSPQEEQKTGNKYKQYFKFQASGIHMFNDQYAEKGKASMLLADDMGLGKTISTFGIINNNSNINRVIIVTKSALKQNWQREFNKWLAEPQEYRFIEVPRHADEEILKYIGDPNNTEKCICVMHYQTMQRALIKYTFMQGNWDMFVLDESHTCANPTAGLVLPYIGSTDDMTTSNKLQKVDYATGQYQWEADPTPKDPDHMKKVMMSVTEQEVHRLAQDLMRTYAPHLTKQVNKRTGRINSITDANLIPTQEYIQQAKDFLVNTINTGVKNKRYAQTFVNEDGSFNNTPGLVDTIPNKLLLSGTPIKNKTGDIYTQLKMLNRELFQTMFPTLNEFNKYFCRRSFYEKMKKNDQGKWEKVIEAGPYYHTRDDMFAEMNRLFRDSGNRCLNKNQVLRLPNKERITIVIDERGNLELGKPEPTNYNTPEEYQQALKEFDMYSINRVVEGVNSNKLGLDEGKLREVRALEEEIKNSNNEKIRGALDALHVTEEDEIDGNAEDNTEISTPKAKSALEYLEQQQALLGLYQATGSGSQIMRHKHVLGDIKAATVANVVAGLAAANPNDKIVLFSYHKSVAAAYATVLDQLGISYVNLCDNNAFIPTATSSNPALGVEEDADVESQQYEEEPQLDNSNTSAKDINRDTKVESFKNLPDVRVLITTMGIGKEGLNLCEANHCVFGELHFIPSVMLQSEDRIYRIGQNHDKVFIYNIALRNSYDSRINDIILSRLHSIEKSLHAYQDLPEVKTYIAENAQYNQEVVNEILAEKASRTEDFYNNVRQSIEDYYSKEITDIKAYEAEHGEPEEPDVENPSITDEEEIQLEERQQQVIGIEEDENAEELGTGAAEQEDALVDKTQSETEEVAETTTPTPPVIGLEEDDDEIGTPTPTNTQTPAVDVPESVSAPSNFIDDNGVKALVIRITTNSKALNDNQKNQINKLIQSNNMDVLRQLLTKMMPDLKDRITKQSMKLSNVRRFI